MSPPSPPPHPNAAATEPARWLTEEVLPHEPAIRGYLQSHFPDIDSDDVVQDSYLKLLKHKAQGQIASAKGYFFTVARNTALVIFRRRKIYSDTPVNALPDSCILEDTHDAAEITNAHQRVALAVAAIEDLPPRCREIFRLAALEKLPVPQIATRLGISENTVYVQIARGTRKCRDFLRERGEHP